MRYTTRIVISILLSSLILQSCGLMRKKPPEGFGSEYGLTEDQYLQYSYLFAEALKSKMLGDYPKCIDLFDQSLRIHPNSGAARYELARVFMDLNDLQGAVSNAESASRLDENNPWYKLLLAELYIELERDEEAINVFDKLLEKDPDNTDYMYEQATLYAMIGKTNKALSLLDEIEKRIGMTETVAMLKIELYMNQNNNAKVVQELEQVIKAFPQEMRYKGMLAEHYSGMGRHAEATKLYYDMLTQEPENGLINLSLANYYRVQNQRDSAYKYLENAFRSPDLEYSVKMSAFDSQMTRLLDTETNPQRIYNLFETLLDANPEEVYTHALYAGYLLRFDQKKKALEQLLLFTDKEKNSPDLWEQLLLIAFDIEDFETMYTQSIQAMGYFPNQPSFYLYNGMAAYHSNRYNEANKVLTNGAFLVVENPSLLAQFYVYLGETYHRQNKHTESDNAFEQAIINDPSNINTINNYAFYLSERKAKLDRALELSTQTVTKNPNSATFLDTHAWVLFQQQNYAEALTYIERALKSGGSSNATILEHYGDILYRNGRTDDAVLQWQKALDTGSKSSSLPNKISKRAIE